MKIKNWTVVVSLLMAGCASQGVLTSNDTLLDASNLVEHSILRVKNQVSFAIAQGGGSANYTVSCDASQAWLLYEDRSGMRRYPGGLRRHSTRLELGELATAKLKNIPAITQACLTAPDWREIQRSGDGTATLIDVSSLVKKENQLIFQGGFDYPEMNFDLPYKAPYGQKAELFQLSCADASYKQLNGFDIDERSRVTDGLVFGAKATTARIDGNTNADYQALFKVACTAPSTLRKLPVFSDRLKRVPEDKVLSEPATETLQAIAGLHLSQAKSTLKKLVVEETLSTKGKTTSSRQEWQISPDNRPGVFSLIQKTPGSLGRAVSFMGLFDLSNLTFYPPGETNISRLTTKTIFTGDWAHMSVGSEIGYETTAPTLFSMIGGFVYQGITQCRIAESVPASTLNSALTGNAKQLICSSTFKEISPRTETYFYLEDYGFTVRTAQKYGDTESISKIIAVE